MDESMFYRLAVIIFVAIFYAPAPSWLLVMRERIPHSFARTFLLNGYFLFFAAMAAGTLSIVWADVPSLFLRAIIFLATSMHLALGIIMAYTEPASIHSHVRTRKLSGSQGASIIIPYLHGESGSVNVEFINAPASISRSGKKRQPGPEYGTWLMEELQDHRKLFAVRQGEWFLCPDCSILLPIDFAQRQTIEYEVQYPGFAPYTLRFTMPAVDCLQCGKTCAVEINGDEGFHAYEALARAFDSAGIKP